MGASNQGLGASNQGLGAPNQGLGCGKSGVDFFANQGLEIRGLGYVKSWPGRFKSKAGCFKS